MNVCNYHIPFDFIMLSGNCFMPISKLCRRTDRPYVMEDGHKIPAPASGIVLFSAKEIISMTLNMEKAEQKVVKSAFINSCTLPQMEEIGKELIFSFIYPNSISGFSEAFVQITSLEQLLRLQEKAVRKCVSYSIFIKEAGIDGYLWNKSGKHEKK